MAILLFRYTARTIEGEVVRGSMSADDLEAALATLRTRALFVTALERDSLGMQAVRGTFSLGKPSRRALLGFFRSFATLIRAGVSIARALSVTIERCTDAMLREALRGVLVDVEFDGTMEPANIANARIEAMRVRNVTDLRRE